jgi:hypothetical protein
MRRLVQLAPFLLLLASCASASILKIDAAVLPPRDPSTVQVLLDEPARKYRTVALVEVSDDGWGLGLEALKKKLTAEAGKLGGDAVVISRQSRTSGAVIMPVGNTYWAAPNPEEKLVGRVIVFE